MKFRNIFVTVGTTEFNNLIKKISEPEVSKILKDVLGCRKLTIQIGRGEEIDFEVDGISVEVFDLKPSIQNEIENADLVSRFKC
jgi:beta-1,4-N-acetylglucosaminyltransferase